ncbi:hypothetical protein ES288_A06G151800v1 [Gossypium darwinii]|uniref:Uncharacterized protein n=1 Tax=Gossypium darwinii TaxID=34276 RepID=A0A5D2G673_GOSDA|nr:hypothetical protein ES288_A06G151800v1 [Gossypium darwinii]
MNFGHVSPPANLLLYRLCIFGIRLWNIRQIVILTFFLAILCSTSFCKKICNKSPIHWHLAHHHLVKPYTHFEQYTHPRIPCTKPPLLLAPVNLDEYTEFSSLPLNQNN